MKKVVLILGGIAIFLVALFALFLIPSAKNKPGVVGQETAMERLTNSLAYATVSDLKTEADYKRVWEKAGENMAGVDEFKMMMEMSEDGNDGSAVIQIKGEEMSMYSDMLQDGERIEMTIVNKDDWSYFGVGDKGFKSNTQFEEGLADEFDATELKSDLAGQEWDGEDIEYKGLEQIGSRKFYTFYSKSDENTLWIDALAILPAQFEDSYGTKGIISYKSINIVAPEGYEDISDLSEEEQGEKFFELLFSTMDFDEENWEMEDWDEEDWFDEDWDDLEWDMGFDFDIE